MRRQRRRRRALAGPFPEEWRVLLERRYDHYLRLPPDLRARFEDDVRILLAETRITGIQVEATDELRLMVAASAVTLSVGWPDYEWRGLTEVLLYPQDFGRDYSFEARDLAGQAHAWGTVILSVPSLRESFAHPDDGFHVGLHEFAHLLDMEAGHADGLPGGFPPRALGHRLLRQRRAAGVLGGGGGGVLRAAAGGAAAPPPPLRDPARLLPAGPGRLGRGTLGPWLTCAWTWC
jgi:Mlc titration factor MtfA (ptsG expression regulator)